MLQGFVADQVIERDLLAKADRSLGRFRGYLCTALDRYVTSQLRRRSTQPAVSFEEWGREATDPATPEYEFNLAWAREVLDAAIERMKITYAVGRPELWTLFKARFLDPVLLGTPRPAYSQLVVENGFTTPVEAMNALVTAKRCFRRAMAEVIAEYAGHDADCTEEVTNLLQCLARPGAGLKG